MSSNNEEEVTRTNVCFKCGGPVPQVGPARTVIVAICEGNCREDYMILFRHLIDHGMDWRSARIAALVRFIPTRPK